MTKYILILAGAALLASCEQKETTVTNPPAENKTENHTTVVKEPPANKTESSTTVNTDSGSTKTETTTSSSPNP